MPTGNRHTKGSRPDSTDRNGESGTCRRSKVHHSVTPVDLDASGAKTVFLHPGVVSRRHGRVALQKRKDGELRRAGTVVSNQAGTRCGGRLGVGGRCRRRHCRAQQGTRENAESSRRRHDHDENRSADDNDHFAVVDDHLNCPASSAIHDRRSRNRGPDAERPGRGHASRLRPGADRSRRGVLRRRGNCPVLQQASLKRSFR